MLSKKKRENVENVKMMDNEANGKRSETDECLQVITSPCVCDLKTSLDENNILEIKLIQIYM